MITNILRTVHAALIFWIIFKIVQNQSLSILFLFTQVILTIFRGILEQRLKSKFHNIQILISIFLGYCIIPNKMRFLGWIFLLKTIEAHRALKAVRKTSSILNKKEDIFRYIAFAYDAIRYSFCEYAVIGAAMLVYRYMADSKTAPLPSDNAMLYQFVVTASTIGYGDVVPKSPTQIIFLTYCIPVLCGSFIIYSNHLIEIFTNTFLVDNSQEFLQEEENLKFD